MGYKPLFTITNQLLRDVARCEAAKAVIDNSLLIPLWERTFQSQALIRMVHHSTAIEGNTLDIKEAEKIISGSKIESMRLRDVREIINYRNAIGFISGIQDKYLTISLLNSVQEILGANILGPKYLGKFRKRKAVIINSYTGDVVFEASDPDEVEPELEDLVEWDKKNIRELHPLIKAGILHYEVVRIHPYADLNGRTARTIATWSLYRDGYDINKFFSLEEHYDQDLQSYYAALDSAHDNDMTLWLEYFVRGVMEEFERIRQKVIGVSRDYKMRNKLGQIALNDRQIKIIEFLQQRDQLANPDFVILFPKISDDTILRDLKYLIDKGIIIRKGRTKGARYFLK